MLACDAHGRESRCGQAGPGGEREAGGRHAFPGDDVAGDRVGRVEGAQVGAAEAAVGREAVALELEEVDDGAVGVDDADAVLDRRRDVEAAVGVEAEPVASAPTELLDDPLARPVGEESLQSAPFDDDEIALAIDGDAVAVHEAVGDDIRGAVALEREDPSEVRLRWGIVAGVGEVHGAVGRDAQVVRRVEPVFEQRDDRAVGCHELQARCHRARRHRRRVLHEPHRADVEPAVLGDQDRTVGGEGRAVRASAGVGESLGGSARRRIRVDSEQRARGHAGDDERAVGAPHRPLAERHPGCNGLGLHRRAQ